MAAFPVWVVLAQDLGVFISNTHNFTTTDWIPSTLWTAGELQNKNGMLPENFSTHATFFRLSWHDHTLLLWSDLNWLKLKVVDHKYRREVRHHLFVTCGNIVSILCCVYSSILLIEVAVTASENLIKNLPDARSLLFAHNAEDNWPQNEKFDSKASDERLHVVE